jgi:hypothetical protein
MTERAVYLPPRTVAVCACEARRESRQAEIRMRVPITEI